MEAEEHFYSDDPTIGPVDARTTLDGVNYFFIGNGFITAVVQYCPSSEGTTLGLILMHPEKFGPKRKALTFDPRKGLSQTGLKVTSQKFKLVPNSLNIDVEWVYEETVPVIQAIWGNETLVVIERFYCPDLNRPVTVIRRHTRCFEIEHNDRIRTSQVISCHNIFNTTNRRSAQGFPHQQGPMRYDPAVYNHIIIPR